MSYSFPEVPAGERFTAPTGSCTKMNTKAEAMEKLMAEPTKYAGEVCPDYMRA